MSNFTRYWNDAVWSKVIANGITAVLTAVLTSVLAVVAVICAWVWRQGVLACWAAAKAFSLSSTSVRNWVLILGALTWITLLSVAAVKICRWSFGRRSHWVADIEAQSLLQALHIEIEHFDRLYSTVVGGWLVAVPSGGIYRNCWNAPERCFNVYESGAHTISKIGDLKLKNALESTYSSAIALIDAINVNNRMLAGTQVLQHQSSPSEGVQTFAFSMDESLVPHAAIMKLKHYAYKGHLLTLLALFSAGGF